ncbi:MAG: hypothetical protein WD512_11650, partial [Candidatus Paceibacterota bacterium]
KYIHPNIFIQIYSSKYIHYYIYIIMNAISDILLGRGENSREIMINAWSERYWMILALLGLILFYIYYNRVAYNIRDSMTDVLRDMWATPMIRNFMIYLTALVLIGYFYPLERDTWTILLLITSVLIIYVTYMIIH